MRMTASQRARLAEAHDPADYGAVVVGTMDDDDGTMTREVRTASSGRVRSSVRFSRRGREL